MTAKSSVIKEIVKTTAPGQDGTRDAVEQERQSRTRPVMLVVVLKSGDELLLSYALFRRALKREGGRIWELVFDDCTVVLTGRNLSDKLREMLRLQKLSFLREGNLIEDDLVAEDEAFIESIEIREKEDA
jgi:hypothetical protein